MNHWYVIVHPGAVAVTERSTPGPPAAIIVPPAGEIDTLARLVQTVEFEYTHTPWLSLYEPQSFSTRAEIATWPELVVYENTLEGPLCFSSTALPNGSDKNHWYVSPLPDASSVIVIPV